MILISYFISEKKHTLLFITMAVPDWQGYWEEEWGKCVEEGRRINEEPIPPENFSAVDFTMSQCPDCGVRSLN